MGTMNGIDERFDGEAYLRTMVERPGQVRRRTAREGRDGQHSLTVLYPTRETDDVRHDQAPDMSPQPLGGG